MADPNKTPGLPGGNKVPKLPGSGGKGKNPFEKKELDILDPEAKAQEKGKKSLGDVAKGIKKSVDKVKKLINFLKHIPPQVLLVIAIVALIIFIVVGVIGFILFIHAGAKPVDAYCVLVPEDMSLEQTELFKENYDNLHDQIDGSESYFEGYIFDGNSNYAKDGMIFGLDAFYERMGISRGSHVIKH